jgi:hypothetical protein
MEAQRKCDIRIPKTTDKSYMSAKQFSPTLNRHDLGDVDGELPHECHGLRLLWKTDLPQKNAVPILTLRQ